MSMADQVAAKKVGGFMRIAMLFTGADEETLRQCPEHDWNNIRAIALIMAAVWLYMSALFSLVAHETLAPDGDFQPMFVVGAVFLATFLLLTDSYMIMRTSWHLHGIDELKRGGLDISGGPWLKMRNGIFLAVRVLLSVALSILCAIFFGLLLFKADIEAAMTNQNRTENGGIITAVRARAGADIQRAADAVTAEDAHVTALTNQIGLARQTATDPTASDPRLRAAEEEIRQLVAEKEKRDDELTEAQTFSSRELGGMRGPGHSGLAGRGPVHLAAEERVRAATARVAAAERALVQARARLDALHKAIGSGDEKTTHEAENQLSDLENDLHVHTSQLAQLREQLATLVNGRDEAIRRALEQAPDRVTSDQGVIGRLKALRHLAEDPEIAAIIILIDVVSFGLELSAVLAKITSFVPTTYSILLARNAYLTAVQLADDMERTINGGGMPGEEETQHPQFAPASPDTPRGESFEEPQGSEPASPFAAPPVEPHNGDTPPATPRRGRGRPRKTLALN